jgi:hypothetical protein
MLIQHHPSQVFPFSPKVLALTARAEQLFPWQHRNLTFDKESHQAAERQTRPYFRQFESEEPRSNFEWHAQALSALSETEATNCFTENQNSCLSLKCHG